MRETYRTIKGSAGMDLAKQAKQLVTELQASASTLPRPFAIILMQYINCMQFLLVDSLSLSCDF